MVKEDRYSERIKKTKEFLRQNEIKIEEERNKRKNRTPIFSKEAFSVLSLVNNKIGIYRLYDKDENLIYIGKSYNLNSRIQTSFSYRHAFKFDFAILNNKADTDVYELYYINKYKPILNGDSNSGDKLTIQLPELNFTQKYS